MVDLGLFDLNTHDCRILLKALDGPPKGRIVVPDHVPELLIPAFSSFVGAVTVRHGRVVLVQHMRSIARRYTSNVDWWRGRVGSSGSWLDLTKVPDHIHRINVLEEVFRAWNVLCQVVL